MDESANPFGAAENTDFLRAVLDGIQDGVYLVDQERRIVFWNSGAEIITGYVRQELLGRFCPDSLLRHCDARGAELCEKDCPLHATLTDGAPRETFALLCHKEGHRVPVRVRATAVRGRDGVSLGAAQVFEERAFTEFNERQMQTLETLRLLDPLTGLASREMIATKLAERLGELQRCGLPFGILLVDIDRLALVNRHYGRDAGDGILRMAAHTLAKGSTAPHLLGRWEKDQFLAIVDNCDGELLAGVAERLWTMLSQSCIQWWGGPVRVTASVAGVLARANDDERDLIARAAALLGEVQCAGGNAFRAGSPAGSAAFG
ncbi:MAG: sensor domain-containing diguanylate cyclase [Acidobacteria bacterium]|nr:sensor domain-containing diguanylate cyclase [Acidobacteriota bacterium]